MNRMTELYCPVCQKAKPYSNFHSHVIIGKDSLPYCKTCITNKLKEYIEATKNDGAGLWCLLAELGIPFLTQAWDITVKAVNTSTVKGRKPNLFWSYLKVLNDLDLDLFGFWQSDKMLDDFIEIGSQSHQDKKEIEPLDYKSEIMAWGKYVTDDGELDEEAYRFLNYTFQNYTVDLMDMDTNLVNRYRDLAKAEWRKRKADENGDIQEIAKAQDNLRKMLDMLNLSKFKDNEVDERKKFIDSIAWMIEETEPAEEEDLEKYRDIAGYEKAFDDIMRSLQNLAFNDRNYPDVPEP